MEGERLLLLIYKISLLRLFLVADDFELGMYHTFSGTNILSSTWSHRARSIGQGGNLESLRMEAILS